MTSVAQELADAYEAGRKAERAASREERTYCAREHVTRAWARERIMWAVVEALGENGISKGTAAEGVAGTVAYAQEMADRVMKAKP